MLPGLAHAQAGPSPTGGHAALYMLDGQDLEWLSRRNPPVLVAIGYDVPTRNDVVARAYDYMPRRPPTRFFPDKDTAA